jgi:hypothetical protein
MGDDKEKEPVPNEDEVRRFFQNYEGPLINDNLGLTAGDDEGDSEKRHRKMAAYPNIKITEEDHGTSEDSDSS